MTYPFQIVDVFGNGAFDGNPVAVVTVPEAPDAATMQRIARWLNLSETTFLLPPTDPQADYRVRIFSLNRELPFAGHPTLGTCHAWLHAGGTPQQAGVVVQECAAGLVPVQRGAEGLAFAAPPVIRSGAVEETLLVEVADLLGIARREIIDAQWVDNGPGWVAVMLASGEAVLAVNPKRAHPRHIDLGVVGLYPPGHAAAYEIRAFFSDPFGGLVEDPVCGSLNASVAQWLTATGRAAAPYTVWQGAGVDRDGRIRVEQADDRLWIGGATRTLFSGVMA